MKQTGDKPYQSDVCGKEFSLPDKIKEHKMTHTGDTPYICDAYRHIIYW